MVLAAGIGSRFAGGVKQLQCVGPSGEVIMDYSIHDAIEAGFNRFVFIIRHDIQELFDRIMGDRIRAICEKKGVEVKFNLCGMFTGELIREQKYSGERKTVMMLIGAVVLAVVAWLGNYFVPINKMLWSSTFVCAVGSYSLAMMAIFYYIVDVKGWQKWTLPFRVVGMNSITIYLAQSIIGFSGIAKFFFGGLAGLCSEPWAAVVNGAAYVLVCWLFLYFLYRQKIFLKV